MKPNLFQFKFSSLFMLIGLLLAGLTTSASHFRYMTVNWEVISTGPGGTVVEFNVTQSWRSSFNFSSGGVVPPGPVTTVGQPKYTGIFQFGDGAQIPLVINVNSINVAEDWFVGNATFTHTYQGSLNRTARFTGCCRIAGLGVNSDDTYDIRTRLSLSDPTNNSPVANTPPIFYVPVNQVSNIQIAAFDPDGDALSYAFATSAESGLTQPIPQTPNGPATLSPTGVLSINTTGLSTGIKFATQIIVGDARGATVPLDFVIQTVGASTPPAFVYPPTPASASVISVGQGNTASFSLQASDVDPGSTVDIFATGLPSGATLSGTPGNPATYSFSWTPTGSDLGAYVIAFTAQDNLFAQANTSVTVFVKECSINATGTVTDASCIGGTDGAIDLSLTGDFGNPTFSWTGPNGFTSSMEDISGLEAGTYSVVATGDFGLGCSTTASFDVEAMPDHTPPTAIARNLTVVLDGNGEASIIVESEYSAGSIAGTLPSQNTSTAPASQTCNCPTGFVAVGYEGFAGCITDNFRLICKELNSDGTLGAATITTCFSGGNTITPFSTSLTGDDILVGFNVTDVDYQFASTRIHSQIQGIGKSLSEIAQNDANNSNTTVLAGLNGAGCFSSNPATSTQYAPDGNVIVGMEVHPSGYSSVVKFNYAPINLVLGLDSGSYDNCAIASLSASQLDFTCADIGQNTVTLFVSDASGNTATTTATVEVLGAIPSCSIASIPDSGAYTGGSSTTLYLGYGVQSTTLNATASGGSSFSYNWSGDITLLSDTTIANPVFTPTSPGSYTYTLAVTNEFGCSSTCDITIDVVDVVCGKKNNKVLICHNGNSICISPNAVPAHLANHSGDYLGSCMGSKKSASVKGASSLNVSAYPSPYNSSFSLEIISDSENTVDVMVYGVNGKIIEAYENVHPSGLPPLGGELAVGMYIISVNQNGVTKRIKIIKE